MESALQDVFLRYKELQAQGRDAANHDFKSEWIPYWTKRVSELFDKEVLEKTDDLMKKYDLSSVVEPRRDQFPRKSTSGRHHEEQEDDRGGRKEDDRDHRRQKSPRGDRRNVSPPGRGHDDRPRTPSRASLYSGISELEERRDGGFRAEDSLLSMPSLPRLEQVQMGDVKIVPCIRLLTALEDILGSLGPAVNQVLAPALALGQGKEGASMILLEDPDTVSILDMVREKLSGQLAAHLLEGSKEGAVRVCLDNLARLLQSATKKRSSNPAHLVESSPQPSLVGGGSQGLQTEAEAKLLLARSVAIALVQAGKEDISDAELEVLMDQLMRETASVDNSIVGQVAKNHLAAKQRAGDEDDDEITVVEMEDVNKEEREELDGLTMEELRSAVVFCLVELKWWFFRSLLQNFQNLSRQEQTDMIAYMRRLEVGQLIVVFVTYLVFYSGERSR